MLHLTKTVFLKLLCLRKSIPAFLKAPSHKWASIYSIGIAK